MAKYYSMKDLQNKLGMSVYTVRHYADHGLIPNLKRDEYGRRLINDEGFNWLKAAELLRGCGLTVAEVRQYFQLCLQGPKTIPQRIKIMSRVKAANAHKINDLQSKQAIIADRLAHYQDILQAKTKDDSNPQTWNPKKFC